MALAARGSFMSGIDVGAANAGAVFAWFIIMMEVVGVRNWEVDDEN